MGMIEVNGVWKTYSKHLQLGIKERLVGKRKFTDEGRYSRSWALQDINFEVFPGRSLGIIGHNGTGKSTLLSLLLGTIRVDKGNISRKGRIGAMLELGSGCHPELTGRENIFLNGAILGMRIAEIKHMYNSIVEFSELGAAIDLPMRTYSSGMSARLAFAVLAHAQRDVLLIDEILAVGDASFQTKCAGYLHNFTERGGTLVVVSHDLKTIEDLCVEGIWLEEGRLIERGSIVDVVRSYQNSVANGAS